MCCPFFHLLNNERRNDEDYSSSDKLVQNLFIIEKNHRVDDDQSSTSAQDNISELCHHVHDNSSDDDTIVDNFDKNYPHSSSLDSTPSLANTINNMNDNVPKPADDNYDWIVTETNNRSQLDQGSESAVMSDKSLIHDYIDLSPTASLPTFHDIDKTSHKPDGQGNAWTVDTNGNAREQCCYYLPQLTDINLISPLAIVRRSKRNFMGNHSIMRWR